MSDLLKSAMGYFNAGPTTTTTSSSSGSDNDFVGQIVEVGSLKLRVKRVIAEGQSNFRTFELAFHATKAYHQMQPIMMVALLTHHKTFRFVHRAWHRRDSIHLSNSFCFFDCFQLNLMEVTLNQSNKENFLCCCFLLRS